MQDKVSLALLPYRTMQKDDSGKARLRLRTLAAAADQSRHTSQAYPHRRLRHPGVHATAS